MDRRRDDLPALGGPTRPTSAISLSSRRSHRSWPRWPGSATCGAWLTELLKCGLPLPPSPPAATTASPPGTSRSASTAPVSSSVTTVPAGTARRRSAPARPVFRAPAPGLPCWARHSLRLVYAASEATSGVAKRRTEPPRPPSPPSGPPRGTYGSRRNDTAPLPPLPARTRMRTASAKVARSVDEVRLGGRRDPVRLTPTSGSLRAIRWHWRVEPRERVAAEGAARTTHSYDRAVPAAREIRIRAIAHSRGRHGRSAPRTPAGRCYPASAGVTQTRRRSLPTRWY